jgi:hypothetical protein
LIVKSLLIAASLKVKLAFIVTKKQTAKKYKKQRISFFLNKLVKIDLCCQKKHTFAKGFEKILD